MSSRVLDTLDPEKRYTFTGEFSSMDINSDMFGEHYTPSIVLGSVKLNGEKPIHDIVVFNYGKSFSKLGELKHGEVIQFDARITRECVNIEGSEYYGEEKIWSYTLERPTKVKSLSETQHTPIPTDTKALLGYIVVSTNMVNYNQNKEAWSPVTYYTKFYNEWKSKNMVNS